MEHYFQDRSRGRPRKERTKAIIVDGVIQVLATQGDAAVSARTIAAATGLAVATIYNHFPDMEAVLAHAADCVLQEAIEHAEGSARVLEDAPAIYVRSTRKAIEYMVARPVWARLIRHGAYRNDRIRAEMVQGLVRDVQRGIAQGHFTVQPSPVMLMHLAELVGTCVRAMVIFGQGDDAIRDTCAAGLRMLGMDADRAAAFVAAEFADADQAAPRVNTSRARSC